LRVVEDKQLLLFDVFNKFDKGKSGSLTREEFKRMLIRLSDDLNDEEINGAFDLIDSDNSNSVEFEELNNYFSKVNGIPEHMNRPQNNVNVQNSFHKMFNQHAYQPTYQQPIGYPLPPQYYPPPPPQNYQPPPPQHPQPPQYQGFVMNQLFQNMNSRCPPQYNQNWQKKH
jgi:hypothetical protein